MLVFVVVVVVVVVEVVCSKSTKEKAINVYSQLATQLAIAGYIATHNSKLIISQLSICIHQQRDNERIHTSYIHTYTVIIS